MRIFGLLLNTMATISKKTRLWVILSVLVVSTGLDQWTKSLAINLLKGRPSTHYWGDLFRLQYVENAGSFLGMGSMLSEEVRFWLLTVGVSLFLAGCIAYLVFSSAVDRVLLVVMSLVVSGGASNVIDRVWRTHGRVVDFMNMGIGDLRTGIFNVADVAIMAGLFYWSWLTLFKKP